MIFLLHLNVRHDTIKLPEENIGKTISNIKCINVSLGQSPKATEIKTKINKWDLIKLTSFCKAKEAIKKKKNEKTTYGMEENIANNATHKGLIFKIYKQPI